MIKRGIFLALFIITQISFIQALNVDIPIPTNFTLIVQNLTSNNSLLWDGHAFVSGAVSSIEIDPLSLHTNADNTNSFGLSNFLNDAGFITSESAFNAFYSGGNPVSDTYGVNSKFYFTDGSGIEQGIDFGFSRIVVGSSHSFLGATSHIGEAVFGYNNAVGEYGITGGTMNFNRGDRSIVVGNEINCSTGAGACFGSNYTSTETGQAFIFGSDKIDVEFVNHSAFFYGNLSLPSDTSRIDVGTGGWNYFKSGAFQVAGNSIGSFSVGVKSVGNFNGYYDGAGHMYTTSGSLGFGSNGNVNDIFINTSHNVLIGTSTEDGSGARLQVNGQIRGSSSVISGNSFASAFATTFVDMSMEGSGLNVGGLRQILFSSVNYDATGTKDLSLTRGGVGILNIGDGGNNGHGNINVTNIQVNGNISSKNTTTYLQIQPSAYGDGTVMNYGTGIGTEFFKGTKGNPSLRLYGNRSLVDNSVLYADIYADGFGRGIMGGNVYTWAFVTGLETDGALNMGPNSAWVFNHGLNFGVADYGIMYATSSLGTGKNAVRFMGGDNAQPYYNMANTNYVNPTFFVHSNTPNVLDEWISISHNTTTAVIDSGKGGVYINGSVLIPGNITFNYANFNQYHAGMFTSSETGITGMTLNSTLQITNFTSSNHRDGFSWINNNTLQLIDPQGAGHYQVIWNAQETGINNHVYIAYIFVNGVQQNNTMGHAVGQQSNEFDISGEGFIELAYGDTVTLRIKDVTGTTTPTIFIKNLNLIRFHK